MLNTNWDHVQRLIAISIHGKGNSISCGQNKNQVLNFDNKINGMEYEKQKQYYSNFDLENRICIITFCDILFRNIHLYICICCQALYKHHHFHNELYRSYLHKLVHYIHEDTSKDCGQYILLHYHTEVDKNLGKQLGTFSIGIQFWKKKYPVFIFFYTFLFFISTKISHNYTLLFFSRLGLEQK